MYLHKELIVLHTSREVLLSFEKIKKSLSWQKDVKLNHLAQWSFT